jgi:hypothetical protein
MILTFLFLSEKATSTPSGAARFSRRTVEEAKKLNFSRLPRLRAKFLRALLGMLLGVGYV